MQYQVEQWLHSTWVKDTRFYNLDLCQDLFGSWIVRRNWGSRPKRGFGQSNYTICSDFETALVLFEKEQEYRGKRGYAVIESVKQAKASEARQSVGDRMANGMRSRCNNS